jgi:predicted membrane chloride channel (bestrophin family)
MFGIEELAIQLEEPFSILPLQDLCDGVLLKNQALIDWRVSAKGRHSKP